MMNRRISACVAVGAVALLGVVLVVLAPRPWRDASEITGAAPETCFNCRDLDCGYCPPVAPCKERHGYCTEAVRNTSQMCAPSHEGDWERCKTRFDESGSCVVRLVNPCTREAPICANPVEKCGILASCIPEGVCIP
jgi:hypothetical protein